MNIIDHLNQLNLKLQSKNQNIANSFGHVTRFRKKLELSISQIINYFTFLVEQKYKLNIQNQTSSNFTKIYPYY